MRRLMRHSRRVNAAYRAHPYLLQDEDGNFRPGESETLETEKQPVAAQIQPAHATARDDSSATDSPPPENPETGHCHVFPAALIVAAVFLGAFLILFRLGDRALWEDEGETAVVALNVLQYGFPRMYDGRNVVTQDNEGRYYQGEPTFGRDYGDNYIESYHSWLQHYVAAASLAFFDRDTSFERWTMAARFPFALLGILSLITTGLVVYRLTGNPWITALTLLFMVFNPAFLLHMRQCRYYALLALLTPLVVYFYCQMLAGKTRAALGFIIAAALLFHSHYWVFVSTYAALGIHYFSRQPHWRGTWKPFLLATGFVVLLTAPWFFAIKPYEHTSPAVDPQQFMENVYAYLTLLNHAIFPLALLPVVGWILWKTETTDRPIHRFLRVTLLLMGVVAFLQAFNLAATRNLLGLLPLGMALVACSVVYLYRTHKVTAVILALMILFTDMPNVWLPWTADKIRGGEVESAVHNLDHFPEPMQGWVFFSTFAAYVYEITHAFDGPVEKMVKHLRQHADSNDVVLTNYDWDVIIFYTDLRLANRIPHPEHPDYELNRFEWGEIDWVSPRKDWPKVPHMFPPDWEEWLARDFEPVVGGVLDIPWNTTPQYHHHWYIAPPGEDIMLYERKNRNDERDQ